MHLSRLFRSQPTRGAGGLARPLPAAVVLLALIAALESRADEPREVLLAQATAEEDEQASSAPTPDDASGADDAPPETGTVYEPPAGVEVMRVRGRGIAAIATEVPDSVTQFDASTIQALGAQNVSDLSKVTPNVNIVQPGATQATFFVRGVGLSDFSSNAAGAVTIFQDGVSLNAPAIQTGSLFDIEDVQIVRGPQGTGAFRNASAGAIRVRSRRPTGNYSAQLRSTLGVYDTIGDKGAVEGALIQDYEGALEMPIVEDLLSTRFAFRLRDSEPYKKNGCGDAIPFDQRLGRLTPGTTIDDIDICGEGRNPDTGRFSTFPPGRGQISLIPEGLPSEVGDQGNWAARGTLRLQPRETEMDFVLSFHGSRLDQFAALGQAIGLSNLGGLGTFFGGTTRGGYRDEDQAPEFNSLCQANSAGQCTNPNAGVQFGDRLASGNPLDERPYRGDYNRVGKEIRDAWGGFLSGEGKLFDLDLRALASFDTYDRRQDQDTDFTPDLLFEQTSEDEAWQTYEELSIGGELEAEPFSWEIGAYYLHEELEFAADTPLRLNNFFSREYEQIIDSFGVWGGFEWDFLDDFTLGGGVRYNWERKEFDYTAQQTIVGAMLPSQRTQQSETWTTPTGEIVLTYYVDEDVSTYAKYSRGFKAGHFNAIASDTIGDPPADPEFNDAWEIGLQGRWLDGRISILTAFFYYRYENYQVFLFRDSAAAPPALEILNAEEAETYGIEIEGTLLPLQGWAPRAVEGLRLSANFGWLHGEYLEFGTFIEQLAAGQVFRIPVDFSGEPLQNAPDYKVSGTVEWTFDLGRYGYLVPRYDLQWTDDVFFDASAGRGTAELKGTNPLPDYAIGQKAYFLHNVRLAYRTPTGNVELAGWIRNVDDQVYKTFAFDASTLSRIVINFPGEPRTIGVDLTVNF